MADPALTIVIAVAEWPSNFTATLDSVAQQRMPDVEVVAVVATHLFQNYVKDQLFKRRIRHYVAEPGTTAGGLLRMGTDAARGPLVAWVMGDFVLDPRRLEAQAEALQRTGSEFATCGIRGVDESGWVEPAPTSVAGDTVAMLRALVQGKVSPATIVVKRKSLDAVGGFNPAYECMFELDLAVRLALRYSAVHVPFNLIRSVPFRPGRPERKPETRRIGELLIEEGASSGLFDDLKKLGAIVSAFDPETRPLGAAASYLATRIGPADLAIGVPASTEPDPRSLAAQMGVPDARTVVLPSTSPLCALSEMLSASDAGRIVVLPADAPPLSPKAFAAQVLHAAEHELDACLPIVDSLVYEAGPGASAIPGTLFTRPALEKIPLVLARTEPQFWALFSSTARVGGLPPAHPVQRPNKRLASTRLLRRPNPRIAAEDLIVALVDGGWYLAMNPDVAADNADPVDHFLNTGWRERRNPNPWFDTAWYLGKNPDVLVRDINPLQHFVLEGAAAGLSPSPGFDIAWYSRFYLDADQPLPEALLHFMTVGLSMGAVPFPRLRLRTLARRPRFGSVQPDEPARPEDDDNLLEALVDAGWYRANYAPAQGPLFNAAADYFEQGWRLGYNPNPWFDTRWYLSQNSDASAANVDPLTHFVKSGARLGRRPHPFFDLEWYTGHYLGGLEPSADSLRHFLAIGLLAGAVPHPRIATPAVKKRLLETPPNGRSALIKRLYALLTEAAANGELPLSSDQDLWPLGMAEELPEGVLPVLLICGPSPESWDRARAAACALPMEEYALFGVIETERILRIATSLDNGALSLRLRVPEQGEMLTRLLTSLNCSRAVAVDARLAESSGGRAVRWAGVPLFENGPGRRRRSSARGGYRPPDGLTSEAIVNKDSDRTGTDRQTPTATASDAAPATLSDSYVETSGTSATRSWSALLEELAARLMDAGFKTGKVLDAACGPGLLVAEFRRRGVEAFGVDSCEEALAGAPEHIRRYCRVQEATEPLDDSYDLIVCINGIGRLPDGAQSALLRSLTAAAPALFFVETGDAADTLARRTGVLEWIERFAGYGFAPSLTFSTPGFGDCAMLLRRGPAPAPEIMRLLAECMQLRAAAQRPSPAATVELGREQERARLLEGQLMREREYLETLRGTHAFLMQEVQKLRSVHPAADKGAAPPDMDALLARIREELAGELGVVAQDDVWRIVQDQTDLRAQFTRLERRTTGNERSLQQVAERVDGILKSKIWKTLVSAAAVVLRFTGRGTRS